MDHRQARDLVQKARPIGPSDRILDLACGSGLVARILSERLGAAARVASIDADAATIDRARAGAPGVTWVDGHPSALPFSDGSFELVLCERVEILASALPAVLREVHRVLTPAGRFLALAADDPHPTAARLLDAGFIDVRMEVTRAEGTATPATDRTILSARRA